MSLSLRTGPRPDQRPYRHQGVWKQTAKKAGTKTAKAKKVRPRDQIQDGQEPTTCHVQFLFCFGVFGRDGLQDNLFYFHDV